MLEIVKAINGILWGIVLVVVLVGCGIIFTFYLRGIQVRKFGKAFKQVFGGFTLKGEKAGAEGMSSFQSLATAIAAQVGTGNLAGAATAIVSGGPGAIFWMWLSAFFGMATIFSEAVLAQLFKKEKDGEVTGGPAYYLKYGLKSDFLAKFFAVTIILALGFIGNMVQANSIGSAFSSAFNINPLIVGILLAIVSGFVFIGGISRIASLTEKLVPIMAGFYVIGGVIILVLMGSNTLDAIRMIFVGAFNPSAVLGGAAGVMVKDAIRYGVARGLFSNEAGMGSTPHAHAVAKVDNPVHQGLAAIVGVFIDTFIVLNITALVIIATGANLSGETGIAVTQKAFEIGFGHFGLIFVAVSLLFFAFSTIVGWYFFAEANIKFLFGSKGLTPFRIIVLIFIVIGTTQKVELVWELADMFNGIMVIPNVIGLIGLAKMVKSTLDKAEKNNLI
ncbi:alanine/glycine:cation symporter family protein [Peptostreptococcus anaerobius]|uniref:alanine/glycine:cation symporter family protein n=1 Tax=Peptostreptococcus TaxID=1257 RepID=UPI000338D80B|nr:MULTISPECIES: sodium:alanine symporter family protein [Peptostreptococcus]MDB8821150.1 sodium:alanine symporter family protein [Peptostreptococcus anaerobius]MDB8825890.1 sodium:alanine symporter family protein [Peptostreptococcus anaerobius]MDB8827678.1 sodium:alanine symporter family protein [Peptostreptococcus anaerobius]MDB8829453.1 sodium:alanine symporter family protein [Peptostreptococcus anaerobius]MDB8831315.1 sodium:alanine symporter family protein [Peptostreptococcus anaerobius]